MSYAGNPANWPTSFVQPADHSPATGSSVNVPDQALADRTAWLRARKDAHSFAPTSFTSGTTEWTCPSYVTLVELEACGGGGAGGGGANGGTTNQSMSTGGGGGGAAQRSFRRIAVTPGTVYEVIVGAGGSPGVANFSDGGDGADTIFREKVTTTVLARFRGATGGRKGVLLGNNTLLAIAPGGAPVPMYRPERMYFASGSATNESMPLATGPGFGGEGVTAQFYALTYNPGARRGSDSIEGFAGGPGGAVGADGPGGSYPPGGGGGGGSASAFGSASAGWAGGAGSTGTGGAAETGGGAGYGYGSGGGGGGGGGSGPGGGGSGSNGHAGVGGILILRPMA